MQEKCPATECVTSALTLWTLTVMPCHTTGDSRSHYLRIPILGSCMKEKGTPEKPRKQKHVAQKPIWQNIDSIRAGEMTQLIKRA